MVVEPGENTEVIENTTAGDDPGAGEAGANAGGDDSPHEAAEYTPNFEYSILDQKYVMPERIQALIKSKEDEDFFRDVWERAHGLDPVKADRQSLRTENQSLKQENASYKEYYENLRSDAQRGDWDTYFERQGVPPEVILKQAQKLLKVINDPAQQQTYVQQRQMHWNQVQQSQEAQALERTLVESREREVSMMIQYNPQINSAAQQFDARMGQGAFVQEMKNYGTRVWMTEKRDASPEEAANYLLKLMGMTPMQTAHAPNAAPNTPYTPSQGQNFQPGQQGATAGQPLPPQVQAQPPGQARPPVPVLPHIEGGGGGGAPVRRPSVQSVEDIRRIRSERRAMR